MRKHEDGTACPLIMRPMSDIDRMHRLFTTLRQIGEQVGDKEKAAYFGALADLLQWVTGCQHTSVDDKYRVCQDIIRANILPQGRPEDN